MNSNEHILSLDVGERRIGVALASRQAMLAAPLLTIDRQKETDPYTFIKGLTQQHSVGIIVVGMPRGLSGQDTEQTAIARTFARELQAQVEAVIVMQDEAGTSLEAEEILKLQGKDYSRSDIDAKAAALILTDYIQQSARNTT
jgi:putative Holliday junction resolvase